MTPRLIAVAVLAMVFACSPTARAATLSNVALPTDTRGAALITGEANVLRAPDGAWYFYFNNWGGCADVDCCASPGGCASCCYVPSTPAYPDPCVFTSNHSVVAYRTTDLEAFEFLGDVLVPAHRPKGIEFRPHVVYNARTQKYVPVRILQSSGSG